MASHCGPASAGGKGGGPVGPNANTRMQDGRHFTDYRPRSDQAGLTGPGAGTGGHHGHHGHQSGQGGSSFELKDRLLRDAEGAMAKDRSAAAAEVGGAGWADSAVALPGFEAMAECTSSACSYLAAAAPFEGGATGVGRK